MPLFTYGYVVESQLDYALCSSGISSLSVPIFKLAHIDQLVIEGWVFFRWTYTERPNEWIKIYPKHICIVLGLECHGIWHQEPGSRRTMQISI